MNSLNNGKSFWSRFTLPHAFTILFFILVVFGFISLVMSWIGVTYVKDGKTVEVVGAGILDWFSTLPAGFIDAALVILFILVLGGFINVVIKTKALEALIGKIATNFRTDYQTVPLELKRENPVRYYYEVVKQGFLQTWVVIPLMLFFSFAGTTYGMAEESLAFYAIIIPIALAAGFDVWTGFLIIFVGAGAGVMGSTINPFSILTAVDATKGAGVAIQANDGAAWRWLAWVVFTLASIIFVMVYAARVKQNKDNSAVRDLFEEHSRTFQGVKVGDLAPVLTWRRVVTSAIFLFTFIFMVLMMLNYDKMASVKGGPMAKFEQDAFGNNLQTSWFHNATFTTGIGWEYDWTVGFWYFGSLITYFFIVSLIIALINWNGEKNYINEMMDGAKDMILVAFAIGISRSISILLRETKMNDYFVQKLSAAISDSSGDKKITIPLLSYIFFIPLTFLIPSTSGLATAAFPILGPAVNAVDPAAVSGTITAYGWAAGFANMFVPTYGVVIGALAIAKIPFGTFFKAIWKYLLMMFLIGFFMVVIGGTISGNVF